MKHSKGKNKIPQLIMVMGPPGSGKGTQANLLAEKFDLYHWETSKVIGHMIAKAKKGAFVVVKGKKYYFADQKKIRKEGKVWDGPFVFHCIKSKLTELAKQGKNIVMTGSPRTSYEGKVMASFLKKLFGPKNIVMILITLTAKDSIWRNVHRRECELAHHSILYSKETIKLKRCPLDGSKLVSRVDDTSEVIKIRLKEYNKKTLPAIGHFKKAGIKVKKIKGRESVEKVFKSVLKAIK